MSPKKNPSKENTTKITLTIKGIVNGNVPIFPKETIKRN